MLRTMYPFWSALTAAVIAQFLKPFFYYMRKRRFRWRYMFSTGGFPSSHSALVAALAMSVGLQEHFSSTLFAVSLALAVIVIYDAANVRFYSGLNIRITRQLVKDVEEELNTVFDNPIYDAKIKDVLGHTWSEVIGGVLLGLAIALLFHFGS